MTTTTATPSRARTITLWTTQIVIGLFMVVAAAIPKLAGEATAVQMFHVIGGGDTLRYVTGLLELAGGIGLLLAPLAGLAALGLVGLLIGATYTQLFVLDGAGYALTPALLGVVLAIVAWARRSDIKALPSRLRR